MVAPMWEILDQEPLMPRVYRLARAESLPGTYLYTIIYVCLLDHSPHVHLDPTFKRELAAHHWRELTGREIPS